MTRSRAAKSESSGLGSGPWQLLAPARPRPGRAVVAGVVLIAVAAAVSIVIHDRSSRAVPGLLFVVPVVVAASIGGQLAALAVAAVAAGTFALFLPPLGSVAVRASEDVVALAVFLLVVAATGRLVSLVIDAQRARAGALEALERQRSALLRSVSHDLRTPLTAIRAAASELQSDPSLPKGGSDRLLELISDEADRLDRLVGNLLSMSRIEAGALQLEREPVDLEHLMSSCLARQRRLTRSVRVVSITNDDVGLVHADGVRIEQVIVNLLDNAVKHSPSGGTIEVSVRAADGDIVRVQVADEGPGLGGRTTDDLFEPFAVVSDTGSSGIGLAICRAIVEEHGGSIGAADRAGGGAVVWFDLPRGQSAGDRGRRRGGGGARLDPRSAGLSGTHRVNRAGRPGAGL